MNLCNRNLQKPNLFYTLSVVMAIVFTALITGCTSSSPNSSLSTSTSTSPANHTENSSTSQLLTQTPSPAPEPTSAPVKESDPITLKLAKMTLEEKVGQMLLVGIEGTVLDAQAKRMITEDKIGGIILYKDNIKSLKGMVQLINSLKKSNSGNPAPLFMSVDQEGGKVSRMPKEYSAMYSNGTVGSLNNANAAEMMGRLLARVVSSAGFNMNFAPVLDIHSNPKNPVIGDRSFGNSASQVTTLGIAEMKGMESEQVIPVIKHFPGHGDTSVDSHLDLPVVNKTADQLATLEWIPFQNAIKEGVDAVMVAHILYPQLDPDKPSSLSRVITTDFLRDQMGYQGLVITDDLTMGAIMKNYDLATAAVEAINAGSDVLLVAHGYDNEKRVREAILEHIKNGKLQEARIDESVYRILALKAKYNLSDEQVPVPDLTDLNKDITTWRRTIQK